jgi:hypothetical protein
MNNNTRFRIYEILLVIVGLGIVTNLLSNVAEKWLNQVVNKLLPNTSNGSLYILSALFIILLILILTIEKSISPSGQIKVEIDRHSLLHELLRRYESRLETKMDAELRFKLELKLNYTKEGTSESFIASYFVKDYKETSAGDFSTLFQYYNSNLKRLLIIGEPGAGKTVLLLNFAKRLISLAQGNPKFPIPIILDLSSWRDDDADFRTWLEHNLVHSAGEFGTTRKHAKELAKSKNLLLLLDGLDEVPESSRDSCMQQMFAYLQQINNQRELDCQQLSPFPEVIICCRTEEYKKMLANAPVQASVRIETLAEDEVIRELSEISMRSQTRGNSAEKLVTALENYSHLRQILTSAFHVHLSLKLAGTEFDFNKVQTHHDLVRTYITKQLDSLHTIYCPAKTFKTLVWLANKLSSTRKGISFELIDIEVSWVKRKWFPLTLNFLFVLVILSFAFRMANPSPWIVVFAIIVAITTTISFNAAIEPDEGKSFSIRNINKQGLVSTLGVGLFLWMTLVIVLKVTNNANFYKLAASAFVVICCIALIFSGVKGRRKPKPFSPYQRLYGPFLLDFALISFAMVLGVCMAAWISKAALSFSSIFNSFVSVALLALVINPLFRHFILRLVLYFEGVIPFGFAKFLNNIASKAGLIERDGGQWRFRHQRIQDELRLNGPNWD